MYVSVEQYIVIMVRLQLHLKFVQLISIYIDHDFVMQMR